MAGLLGKLPAKHDTRNFPFAALMTKRATKVPVSYDVDVKLGRQVPTPMYLNDEQGDCVIAGRAHQTLRFEYIEQKKVITITDKEVDTEYHKETGGPDTGLIMHDSLNAWRRKGWVAGKQRLYIKSWAEVTGTGSDRQAQVKAAVYSDVGIQCGILVVQSAIDQFDAGKTWDVAKKPGGELGGHCIYIMAYDKAGLTCVTWAKKQRMTWRFFLTYCDEAYATFDEKDTVKRGRLFHLPTLARWLEGLR